MSLSMLEPPKGASLVDAILFVGSSSMAKRVLEYLARFGKTPTKPLLRNLFGKPSKKTHRLLNDLAALGLIRRYSGHNEDGYYVVWNEITELGRRVLGIVESMES